MNEEFIFFVCHDLHLPAFDFVVCVCLGFFQLSLEKALCQISKIHLRLKKMQIQSPTKTTLGFI